ncbi:MAG TPA: adenylate/guanylate cyclase domain-containing protein [Gallionella sp.]|nr:adenylate/guanylate cyclase domain-containing protein [Gallionella sp.]
MAMFGMTAGDPVDTQEVRLRKSLLIFACAFMNLAVVLWLAIYWLMGLHFSTNVPVVYQLISVASLFFYFKTKRFEVFRLIQLSLFLFTPFIMQWSIGSYVTSSGVMLWALLAPIGALVVSGWRESIPWFFAYMVMTIISGAFDYFLSVGDDSGIAMKTIGVFFALNFAAMSSIIYFLVRHFVVEMEKIKNQLDVNHELLVSEQEKSERILSNVLPAHIAQRLKDEESQIADGYADLTVMFADLVNFTQLTESLSPAQMVSLLNKIFSSFDDISDKYGVEKIKTIGDAYMVVGGLNPSKSNYTEDIVNMAMEMKALVTSHPSFAKYHLDIHCGVATGPVVAGVIGTKRYMYDLWGDTVNVASRLTHEAGHGMILVDKMTYNRIREQYTFDPPLSTNIKGKGDMVTYRLLTKLNVRNKVLPLRPAQTS